MSIQQAVAQVRTHISRAREAAAEELAQELRKELKPSASDYEVEQLANAIHEFLG